jgi:hypothetical protein
MPNEQAPEDQDLRIYRGLPLVEGELPKQDEQLKHLQHIPPPPPWRTFGLSNEDWVKEAKSAEEDVPSSEGKVPIDPRALGFVADKK